MLIDFGVPQVVLAQNDADGDGGDDEPTTAMPHRHQQANTQREPNIPFRRYPLTLTIL